MGEIFIFQAFNSKSVATARGLSSALLVVLRIGIAGYCDGISIISDIILCSCIICLINLLANLISDDLLTGGVIAIRIGIVIIARID